MASVRLTAFTDGGCTQNGKPGARAAYAAVIYAGADQVDAISGRVASHELELDVASHELKSRGAVATPVAPSNNRGELLGIIHGLRAMIAYGRAHPDVTSYELVTDSRICAMTLLSWLPTRRAAGTVNKLKNLYLVEIAEALLAALRGVGPVTITVVRSHIKTPPADAQARFSWQGNAAADALATAALA